MFLPVHYVLDKAHRPTRIPHRMLVPEIQIDIGKSEHCVVFSDRQSSVTMYIKFLLKDFSIHFHAIYNNRFGQIYPDKPMRMVRWADEKLSLNLLETKLSPILSETFT
ncbi:hypothetical protein L2E82_10489 [Cichorium intybus]|uniref:Uncharacterized protein n=1 Tax=Cichorium intybus TaxID=13427 RepID=A0ACB9GBC0_CICIN|nr:hypothetical protein L2E82_10489 [Cichorium intybus]